MSVLTGLGAGVGAGGGFISRLRSYYGLPKPHLWGGLPGCVRPAGPLSAGLGPKCDFRTRPTFDGYNSDVSGNLVFFKCVPHKRRTLPGWPPHKCGLGNAQ
eukprot:772483-Prymnesium_polylepis.1